MKAYLEDFCQRRRGGGGEGLGVAEQAAPQVGDPSFRLPRSPEVRDHVDQLRAEGKLGHG